MFVHKEGGRGLSARLDTTSQGVLPGLDGFLRAKGHAVHDLAALGRGLLLDLLVGHLDAFDLNALLLAGVLAETRPAGECA